MLTSFDAKRLAKPIKVLRNGGKFSTLWDSCFTCHEHCSVARSYQNLDLFIRQQTRKSQCFWLLCCHINFSGTSTSSPSLLAT